MELRSESQPALGEKEPHSTGDERGSLRAGNQRGPSKTGGSAGVAASVDEVPAVAAIAIVLDRRLQRELHYDSCE